jgi:hypothetical protein
MAAGAPPSQESSGYVSDTSAIGTYSPAAAWGGGGGGWSGPASPGGSPGLSGQHRRSDSGDSAALQQQQRALSTAQHRQVVEQQRQAQAALHHAKRDAQSGKEQVEYLTQVLDHSKQYGRDVEAAIEHLANLLHKKTVECENLRALANENYAPLRNAVRNQFETTLRAEARQQAELRLLQSQIETLITERTKLQHETTSLKALVKELEGAPPHASYNPSDRHLLFNRVAGDLSTSGGGGGDGGTPAPVVSSWNLSSMGYQAPQHPAQRDLMTLLSSIDEPTATKLERAGVFDLLKVVCTRMCTQVKGMPQGHYASLSEVVSQVLRDHRDTTGSGAHNLTTEAGQPVPHVAISDRQRVATLYLANNPNQYDELNMLLGAYAGREGELYQKLKRQYESAEQTADIGAGLRSGGADSRTLGAHDRPDATVEIHARIMVMYRKYNPSKIGSRELNDMLTKYPAELILSSLVEKYGPEPTGDERRALIQSIA